MIVQRLRKTGLRSLRQPDDDTADIDVLPAKVVRASKYLAFDADVDPIAAGLIREQRKTEILTP